MYIYIYYINLPIYLFTTKNQPNDGKHATYMDGNYSQYANVSIPQQVAAFARQYVSGKLELVILCSFAHHSEPAQRWFNSLSAASGGVSPVRIIGNHTVGEDRHQECSGQQKSFRPIPFGFPESKFVWMLGNIGDATTIVQLKLCHSKTSNLQVATKRSTIFQIHGRSIPTTVLPDFGTIHSSPTEMLPHLGNLSQI